MLPLMRTRETVDLVCAGDPSVIVPEDVADYDWVPLDMDGVDLTDGALVVTVRPLSHREAIGCQIGTPEAPLNFTDVGVVKLKGPGANGDIKAFLDSMPLPARLTLGNFIVGASLLPPDPTEADGSA